MVRAVATAAVTWAWGVGVGGVVETTNTSTFVCCSPLPLFSSLVVLCCTDRWLLSMPGLLSHPGFMAWLSLSLVRLLDAFKTMRVLGRLVFSMVTLPFLSNLSKRYLSLPIFFFFFFSFWKKKKKVFFGGFWEMGFCCFWELCLISDFILFYGFFWGFCVFHGLASLYFSFSFFKKEDDLFAGFTYFRNGFLFKKKKFLMLFCLMGFGFHCLLFLTFSNFYLKFFLGGFSCFWEMG